MAFVLHAANVLDRLGEISRPVLPVMKQRLASLPSARDLAGRNGQYPQRILEQTVEILEGKTAPLIYPTLTN